MTSVDQVCLLWRSTSYSLSFPNRGGNGDQGCKRGEGAVQCKSACPAYMRPQFHSQQNKYQIWDKWFLKGNHMGLLFRTRTMTKIEKRGAQSIGKSKRLRKGNSRLCHTNTWMSFTMLCFLPLWKWWLKPFVKLQISWKQQVGRDVCYWCWPLKYIEQSPTKSSPHGKSLRARIFADVIN